MRYILMCGGDYQHWEKPRQMSVVRGEEIVARTIRLLKENGVEDIAISSNNSLFEKYGVPVLKHDNLFVVKWHTALEGDWFNAFYPTNEPVCYIFGDVYFSEEAIKKIVETETDDIEFFGSRPPFTSNYIKDHEEPFALKVVNIGHLREAIEETKRLELEGKLWRKPCMWELWTVIKKAPLQTKEDEYTAEYVVINDYTCDIDWKEDIRKLEFILGGKEMKVKVEVIEDFSLSKFKEISNIKRADINKAEEGMLYKGDVFECTKEMADYLLGNNALNKVVVKLIAVQPEIIKSEVKPIEIKSTKPIKKKKAKK